jgi:hypothetical protein
MDQEEVAAGVTRGAINGAMDVIKSGWKKITGKKKKKTEISNVSNLKEKVNILFIDDEPFDYIETIKEAGWNASQMFEVKNLDDEQLKRSHIIFLDYVGVGKILTPSQQGIGLLKEIKRKYSNKIVIFYSGHAGFSLGQEFKIADDWMPKNSDAYVFLQKIEENAQKIQFE